MLLVVESVAMGHWETVVLVRAGGRGASCPSRIERHKGRAAGEVVVSC